MKNLTLSLFLLLSVTSQPTLAVHLNHYFALAISAAGSTLYFLNQTKEAYEAQQALKELENSWGIKIINLNEVTPDTIQNSIHNNRSKALLSGALTILCAYQYYTTS